MEEPLSSLLTELEAFGVRNDATHAGREERMLNITRDTGEFLDVLVRGTRARRILEIGTSNGYSTLWLASAAREAGGMVTTVERAESKRQLAVANFARAGLEHVIHLLADDAGTVLARMANSSTDLLFLDSERSEYIAWWPDIRRILDDGGLLVVDNATSHAGELAPLMELVRSDELFATSLVPVGNGEFLAVKSTMAHPHP